MKKVNGYTPELIDFVIMSINNYIEATDKTELETDEIHELIKNQYDISLRSLRRLLDKLKEENRLIKIPPKKVTWKIAVEQEKEIEEPEIEPDNVITFPEKKEKTKKEETKDEVIEQDIKEVENVIDLAKKLLSYKGEHESIKNCEYTKFKVKEELNRVVDKEIPILTSISDRKRYRAHAMYKKKYICCVFDDTQTGALNRLYRQIPKSYYRKVLKISLVDDFTSDTLYIEEFKSMKKVDQNIIKKSKRTKINGKAKFINTKKSKRTKIKKIKIKKSKRTNIKVKKITPNLKHDFIRNITKHKEQSWKCARLI